MTKEEIIEKRKGYLPYEEAKRLQKKLIRIYQKEYKPKHKDSVYLKLILDWGVDVIKEKSPQDQNSPETVYTCFSVVSQHIYGFTKKHCLDIIYDAVQRKKQRIKDYKKLPTLQELVESETEIDPEKIYHTKEKGTPEDCCEGNYGAVILEMRKIGIQEYFTKHLREYYSQFSEFFKRGD